MAKQVYDGHDEHYPEEEEIKETHRSLTFVASLVSPLNLCGIPVVGLHKEAKVFCVDVFLIFLSKFIPRSLLIIIVGRLDICIFSCN